MEDDQDRYALMMDAYTEVRSELDTAHRTNSMPVQPTLNQVLADFGPMPEEALFLGVASDELPVLLNLHDPIPGPLLILGDPGSGKTSLLQTIAQAAGEMHQPEYVQFGILTNQTEKWSRLNEVPNNLGIFPVHHRASEDFILSLASWAHGNKSSNQSILLLLDDLEATTHMEMETVQDLRWLLFRGPSRRVWPIITLDSDRIKNMEPWLDMFRTRIFGYIESPQIMRDLDVNDAGMENLMSGSEFTLYEGDHWLRFSIPELD